MGVAALVVVFGALAPTAGAQVRLHELAEGAIRVDGMLRDWRGLRRVRVGRGRDASMEFVLGYDERGLYVAASVRDERFVRTPRFGPNEDAIVVTLAMPVRRRWRASEFWLYAGVEGRSAGAVRMGPLRGRTRPVAGARVVEARTADGYDLEAFVPWRQIPGGRRFDRGARVAVRLRDVDSEARPRVENEPATKPVDPRHLDRLDELRPTGGQYAVLQRFLQSRDMPGARPRYDLSGQLCGDRRPERVVQVGRYVVVLGPGYRDGRGFDYTELPVQSSSDVLGARLRDFTGDGRKELFLRLRQRDARGTRDLWQLFAFDCEAIRPLWALEVRKETAAGHVEARVHVRGGGRGAPPTIEVVAGRAEGLGPDDYAEAPATDAEPILLPWGPILARSYRWDGRRFAVVSERPNPSPHRPAATHRSAETQRAEAAAPRAVAVSELLAAVRRERGIGRRVRPRFVADVNVAGDRRPEHLEVLGKALVVVGPGFRGGNGFFYYEVQVERPEDLLRVETADLTGDGRAEILVYVRQPIGEVRRTLLMVHRFTAEGRFERILAAEVARTRGEDEVRNEVRVRRGRLEIRPGRARGFGPERWPWADAGGGEGIEPLLLPWRDRPRRYRWRGGRLVP